jgi:hypothetical protein
MFLEGEKKKTVKDQGWEAQNWFINGDRIDQGLKPWLHVLHNTLYMFEVGCVVFFAVRRRMLGSSWVYAMLLVKVHRRELELKKKDARNRKWEIL